jgi:isochorismate synthase
MNTRPSVITEKLSETDLFSFLTHHALEHNLSIALWRLPNQTIKHALLAEHYQFIKRDAPIEDLPAGFLFAPYNREKESIFLPADFAFEIEHDTLKAPENPEAVRTLSWLNQHYTRQDHSKLNLHYSTSQTPETGKTNFVDLVGQSVLEIENGTFQKIVISRTKKINLTGAFNVINAFQKLCNTYPNALVSLVSIPGVGSWLGATPEVLVSLQDKTIFKTVALAGTKSFNNNVNLKTVAWTQKEIEEQALVERYIISCFKNIRLREYDEHGPKTIVAGNLMHLKSEFTVDMKATNFPQLGSTMLHLLHPTSAVCGMPLGPALEFIKNHEGYDREFYSGYLGPVNINNNTSLFVNIRCMQLLDTHAICYAGAGITGDSSPDDEWAETELKLNTLLSVII